MTKNRRITLEFAREQYVLVIRIPIEVRFEKGAIVVKEADLPKFALTDREREVLALLCRFKRNKEIASALNMGERTVKFHVSSLLHKAKVDTRSELVTRYRAAPK